MGDASNDGSSRPSEDAVLSKDALDALPDRVKTSDGINGVARGLFVPSATYNCADYGLNNQEIPHEDQLQHTRFTRRHGR